MRSSSPPLAVIAFIVATVGADAACKHARQSDPDTRATNQAVTVDAAAPDEDEGGRIVNDGSGAKVLPKAPITRFQGSGGYWLAPKPAGVVASTSPTVTPKQKVLAQAAVTPPNDRLSVTLILKDVAADWKTFRDAATNADRAAWIQAREASLAPTRQALINWLNANGAIGVEPYWLANEIHAYVPAALVPTALARPEVIDAAPAGTGKDDGEWTGYEASTSTATRLASLASAGLAGRGGGRLRPRVLIALVEQSLIYREHVAYSRSWNPLSPRIQWVKDCTEVHCYPTSASTTVGTHGNNVAAIAASTIQHGEDPAYPGVDTVAQARHSGLLRDSYLAEYLWTSSDVSTVARAVQHAIADGADVVNLSLRAGEGCDRFTDAAGLNGILQNVFATGAVVVAAAGNGGGGSGCTLDYPGSRSEVFSVNGLDTYDDLFSYDFFPILATASRGGVLIRTNDGTLSYMGGVGAVTPGKLTGLPGPPGNGYTAGLTGSSAATPVASAIFGAIRNAFNSVGWSRSAGGMMATALLFGDGWNSDTGAQTTSGMSDRSGAGRMRAHWPSDADLVAPWGWGWRAVTLVPNQTYTWDVGIAPFPNNNMQWKWAIMFPASNLDSVPDIDFYVDDYCNGNAVIASDVGYDLHSRFRLSGSTIGGRCLRMRAHAYSVPASGVTFYSADYFHDGDESVH